MPPRLNLPPLTRGLLLTLLALSTLNSFLRFRTWSSATNAQEQQATAPSVVFSSPQWAVPYLVLVPTKSIRFPWTFLTSALIENNVVSLAISGAVVWFGGKYLERAWGGAEFTKFTIFVTMIPNIVTFFIYALWQGLRGQAPEHPTPINGLLALSASFLVSLKQLVPEHTVTLASALRIRLKHFPALFVLANMLSGPLLGTDTATWLSLFGFLTGWIYLRFFRISDIGAEASAEEGGERRVMKGDPSETFSFVSFFPDFVHPFLAPVCDAVYGFLVQMRLCAPFSDQDVESATQSAASRSQGAAGGGLPGIMQGGGRRAEAERRRALALRALDQRLNAAAAGRESGSAAAVPQPSAGGEAAESVPVEAESKEATA